MPVGFFYSSKECLQVLKMTHEITPKGHTIQHGFDELTRAGFAIWIRFMMLSEAEMIGRKQLAEVFGMSRQAFSERARELRRKGYLKIIAVPGGKTRFLLIKKAIIVGPNQFIKLAA